MQLSPATVLRGGLCAALVSGFLFLSGCSKPVGTVSGTVSYNGKPLKGGNVTLVSTEGAQTQAGAIAEDGTYKVTGVTAGNYKVCVETASLKGAAKAGPMGMKGPPGVGGGGGPVSKGGAPPPGVNLPEGYSASNPNEANAARIAKRYVEIPDKYADPNKTDLTYTVKGGDQTHPIELK